LVLFIEAFFLISNVNLLVPNRWNDGRSLTSVGGRNIRSSSTSVLAHLACSMKAGR
jgi:hypothetical protein